MEYTTSQRNGGPYALVKQLCATSTASIDPTWELRRHATTEAYICLNISARRHLHPSTSHRRYDVTTRLRRICVLQVSTRRHLHPSTPHDTTSHRNGDLYVFEQTYVRRHLHPYRAETSTEHIGPHCDVASYLACGVDGCR